MKINMLRICGITALAITSVAFAPSVKADSKTSIDQLLLLADRPEGVSFTTAENPSYMKLAGRGVLVCVNQVPMRVQVYYRGSAVQLEFLTTGSVEVGLPTDPKFAPMYRERLETAKDGRLYSKVIVTDLTGKTLGAAANDPHETRVIWIRSIAGYVFNQDNPVRRTDAIDVPVLCPAEHRAE